MTEHDCERVTQVSEREMDAHGKPSLKDHSGKDAVILMEALWFPRTTPPKQARDGRYQRAVRQVSKATQPGQSTDNAGTVT